MYKLLSESTIHWHNLVKDPEDLPRFQLPLNYLCVLACEGDYTSDGTDGFCITTALYIPKTKQWMTLITFDDSMPLKDRRWHYRKPFGDVIMWASVHNDYKEQSEV